MISGMFLSNIRQPTGMSSSPLPVLTPDIPLGLDPTSWWLPSGIAGHLLSPSPLALPLPAGDEVVLLLPLLLHAPGVPLPLLSFLLSLLVHLLCSPFPPATTAENTGALGGPRSHISLRPASLDWLGWVAPVVTHGGGGGPLEPLDGGHLGGSPNLLASPHLSHTPGAGEGNHGAGGTDGGHDGLDPVDEVPAALCCSYITVFHSAEPLPLHGTLVRIHFLVFIFN